MFIDADSIVNTDLSKYFNSIKDDELTIEYKLNPTGYWANIKNLNFVDTCKKSWLRKY